MEGVVLITGGTRGIGYGIAQALAAKGFNLILGYNENTKAAQTSRASLLSKYPNIKVAIHGGDSYHMDETIDGYLKIIRSSFDDNLIGVVHNAGGYPGVSTGSAFDTSIRPRNPGQFQSSSDFKWIDYYIKIYGLMFMKLLEKCAPLMEWRKNRGGGSYVIHIVIPLNERKEWGLHCVCALIVAFAQNTNANPGYIAPGSGKSFGEYLVRQYAKEYAERQITVNCIIPGIIKTEAWISYKIPGMDNDNVKNVEELTGFKMVTEKTPMKRFAEPLEVGHLVSYIMSKESLFMTGVAINFDGGLHLGPAAPVIAKAKL